MPRLQKKIILDSWEEHLEAGKNYMENKKFKSARKEFCIAVDLAVENDTPDSYLYSNRA